MRRLHHSLAAFRDDIVLAEVLDDARAGVLRPVPAPTVRWWLRDDLDHKSPFSEDALPKYFDPIPLLLISNNYIRLRVGPAHTDMGYMFYEAKAFIRVVRARLDRDRDGLLVFFVCIILFRVAAAVDTFTNLLVAAAPVVMLASRS